MYTNKIVSYVIDLSKKVDRFRKSFLKFDKQTEKLTLTDDGDVYQIQMYNDIVKYIHVSGDHSYTLPAATGSFGVVVFSNSGTGLITVNRYGTDTISGETVLTFNTGTLVVQDLEAGKWIII